MNASERIVELPSISLNCVCWGGQSRPAVVALHGLRAYGRWFEPLGDALGPRYHVVAPDLRGRNLSSWATGGEYALGNYVDDIVEFVAALRLETFALVGHSLGGSIASELAARLGARVERLVLLDATPEPSAVGLGRIRSEVSRTPAKFDGWPAARAFLKTMHPKASSEQLAVRERCTLREASDGAIVWRLDPACTTVKPRTPEQAWGTLRQITCPILLMRGSESDLLTAATCDAFRELKPHDQVVVVTNAGHMLLEDNPTATVAAIQEWLERRA